MQTLASKMYGQVQHRTAGQRDIEYAVFDQITASLETVAEQAHPDAVMRIDALSRNLQLWALLAADLMSPGNALPDDTRRGLLTLSKFVQREGMKRLSDDGDLADLISINRTIMAGLGASRAGARYPGAA